jgi:hypothetical protein
VEKELADILRMGNDDVQRFNHIPVITDIIRTLLIYKPRSAAYTGMMSSKANPKGRSLWKQYKKLQNMISTNRARADNWKLDVNTESSVIMKPALPVMFSESFTCAGLFTAPHRECRHEPIMDLSTYDIDIGAHFLVDHLISVHHLNTSYTYLVTCEPFVSDALLRQVCVVAISIHLFICFARMRMRAWLVHPLSY